MNPKLFRIAVIVGAVAPLSITTLSLPVTAYAQESAFARKSNAIKANFRLENAVQKTLDREKHLDSSDVRVVAKNGVISLEGTMPDEKEISRATEAAGATPGVKTVTSSLTVREAGH